MKSNESEFDVIYKVTGCKYDVCYKVTAENAVQARAKADEWAKNESSGVHKFKRTKKLQKVPS